MASNLQRTSKFLSLILRHHPEVIGISLDEHGWANVNELIDGVNRTNGHALDRSLLRKIVATDEKQRYSLSADGSRIRANQGHSIPVDVELEALTPPAVLYHGTVSRFLGSIYASGLLPGTRLYVHLLADAEAAARAGGRRRGECVLLRVDARTMAEDGYVFYRSVNNVWLTKNVPAQYLQQM